MRDVKWDLWFLDLAKYISTASKDPSTKCGAVIIDEDRRLVSAGYNGFPKGDPDFEWHYNDRALKLEKIIHAEVNAILFAQRSLKNCTLYTYPFGCCSRCAAVVIQSGIKRVISPILPTEKTQWVDNLKISSDLFYEADVLKIEYDLKKQIQFTYNIGRFRDIGEEYYECTKL